MSLCKFTIGLLSVACIACSISAQAKKGGDKSASRYDKALADYNEFQTRLAFMYHTKGRAALAATRDTRALEILARDYKKPPEHHDYTRYTIAYLLGRHFDREEFAPQLNALRKAHQKPVDMWMWVQTMRIHTNRVGDTETVDIAMNSKNALHRAAAILALGQSRKGRIKNAIVRACIEFPRKAADRCALLGAMSGALWENKRYVNDPDYRAALEAYISLLDPKVGLTHVSKIQMARHLQWILGGPALFVNPEPWLELLSRGDIKQVRKTETRAQPSFFGIETQGERFCYVVDMSDSMCKLIEPDAKPPSARGPLTGPRPKKLKRKKGFLPTESDLPWRLINTRWDLAREQLRISLLRLPEDKYFSVVWFGTESGTFKSCKGMVRATKGNVDRVLAELDKVELRERDPVKAPDGQLKGKTNMHSGLRRAFGLTKKGFVEEAGYVHPKVLTEGCDTIFLLSDGTPSWDDFNVLDKDYGDVKVVVDTEYKAETTRRDNINYHGPYSQDDNWLVEDVRRMNAFRRIRLHCIGLGEANMGLLKRLAKMGNGETFSMGKRTK